MRAFYRELSERARAGEAVATATVIGARGSTPREVGAKMIVRRDGAIVGSVGGGCGEAQVFWEAARVLAEGTPRICEVDLTGEMDDLSQTNCGGVMELFVDCARWSGDALWGLPDAEVVRAVTDAGSARRPVALVVAVDNRGGHGEVPVGAKWVADPEGPLRGSLPAGLAPVLRAVAAEAIASGQSRRVGVRASPRGWERGEDDEGLGLFVDVLAPAPELIVVGAGHIALPLVEMARHLDFEITVIDDRAAFANRERFPGADAVVAGPIEERLRQLAIGPATHVVLITRGHQHDESALKVVIGSRAAYIGMIGSRRRVKEVFRHLAEAGVDPRLTARVHAPIGLDIGAETPAEIAVAIVAELVQVRRAAAAPLTARGVGSPR